MIFDAVVVRVALIRHRVDAAEDHVAGFRIGRIETRGYRIGRMVNHLAGCADYGEGTSTKVWKLPCPFPTL